MIEISDLREISGVMRFFEEISAIPHGSGNCSGIADYLVKFAEDRGLKNIRDKAENVVIFKSATAGYESRPTVILQGHTDMVPAVAEGFSHDWLTEGLKLYREGEFLRAEGTTLGADDGIAVAYALALLDSSDIPHPAIEAVFTADEEIGLLGAAAMDTSCLRGKLMINLDMGAEGVFTVGCAGGLRADAILPVAREAAVGHGYRLKLFGLCGGHSGTEINKGHENAIKLIGELLGDIGELRLVSLSGGNADNAIPRECEAEFVSSVSMENIRAVCESFAARYRLTEGDIGYELTEASLATDAMNAESSERVLRLIESEPTGVIAMSEDIEGLVETSLNMGIVSTEPDELTLTFSLRSSKGAAKAELLEKITKIAEGLGCKVSSHGDYPGWEYKKDSYLREKMCEVWRAQFGKDPRVIAIHAGLECGIFSGKIEGLDCVSAGPTHYDIHTPEERLSLSSTARVWEYLKKLMANI